MVGNLKEMIAGIYDNLLNLMNVLLSWTLYVIVSERIRVRRYPKLQ